MLPTISERRLHERASMDRDGDHRDWRYARSTSTFEDSGPSQAPLPPLRSTLSYRDDTAWSKQLPPPPGTNQQSHLHPRLDLFSHLPRSSSLSLREDTRAVSHQDENNDRYHQPAYHTPQQHHHSVSHSSLHDHPYHSGGMTKGSSAAAAKKRSRRMSNSERGKLYRSRRKEYVETLEDQVEALKQQLEELKMKGNGRSTSPIERPTSPYDTLVLSRDRSRAGFARIVCEYFSLFQFGVPVAPMNGASGHQQLVNNSSTHHFQSSLSPRLVNFIETIMDPNMRFGDNFGVQMLLEQWQRYSSYHSSLQFELNSLEIISSDASPLISATATLRVRFSRTTIEKVFPHVLWNEALVQRLIGLEVEYPVSNKFYFGPDGKIKRYETEVDFMSAFVKALGNTQDAMHLVGKALIKEQHRLGDDDIDHVSSKVTGAEGNRSPTDSVSSSRDSIHSPTVMSSEPLVPRFKQSEARTSEDVRNDRSPLSTSRFVRDDRASDAYYQTDGATYTSSVGEPSYQHHSYTADYPDRHHYRRSPDSDQYHDDRNQPERRHDPVRYN